MGHSCNIHISAENLWNVLEVKSVVMNK